MTNDLPPFDLSKWRMTGMEEGRAPRMEGVPWWIDDAGDLGACDEAAKESDYIAFDTETTGLGRNARVTELGAVFVKDSLPIATYSQLVDPGVPIPPFITRLTGIGDGTVAGKPPLSDVLPRFFSWLDGKMVLGHNVGYDIGILRYRALALGIEPPAFPESRVRDTLPMARRLFPDAAKGSRHRHRLADLIVYTNVGDVEYHHALSDAIQTAECYEVMRRMKGPATPRETASADALHTRIRRASDLAGRDRLDTDDTVWVGWNSLGHTPVNQRPPGPFILPEGGVDVSEGIRGRIPREDSRAALAAYGAKKWLWVTVRPVAAETGREGTVLYVALDGQVIGQVTPLQTARRIAAIPEGGGVCMAHITRRKDTLRLRVELPAPDMSIR